MRHARVFLVEDETLIRLMLAEMIEELGHQIVAEAGSIESALPLAETVAFDIAILDVNIGGYYIDKVAQTIVRRGLPFIFVTGLCQGGTATRFYRQTTSAKTMFARNVATGNNLSSGP